MKKLILFFILLSYLLPAQEWDVVLPPEEQVPTLTTRSALATGNWGYYALQVDQYEQAIRDRAARPVIVFIFDTAYGFDHDDLEERVALRRNYTSDPNATDRNGHGTHCAGIVAGNPGGVKIGAASVLGDKLQIAPYQVLNYVGQGSYTDIAEGLEDANIQAKKYIDQGYFVIYSLSLGGGGNYTRIDQAFRAAHDMGVLVVAAAGNSGREGVSFPANIKGNRAIASLYATAPYNYWTRSNFSTYGEQVYGGAPGSSIYAHYKNGTYATLSGTSMATPHMAAIAAICASIYPEADADVIANHIARHSADIQPDGWDKYTGFGVPLLGKLITETPTDEPGDEPDEPAPDPPAPPVAPTHPKAYTYPITLPDTYTAIWKEASAGEFKKVSLRFIADVTTDLHYPFAYDKTVEAFANYNTNRGYLLLDGSDEWILAYWIAHFTEMLMPRQYDLNVKIAQIEVIDEQGRVMRRAYPKADPRPGARRYMDWIGSFQQVKLPYSEFVVSTTWTKAR